jgi:ATP-dependent DNA helicase RecG
MAALSTKLESLPKIGPALGKKLKSLGLETIEDLLWHIPFRYLDFSKSVTIADIREGEVVTIRGTIKTISSRFSFRGRLSLSEAVISDESGSIKVVWFNQAYLAKTLHKGEEIFLSGKVTRYKTLQMQNPVYEKVSESATHTGRLVPVYHSTENLYNRTIRNLTKAYLHLADELVDEIPDFILKQQQIISLPEAIKILHFPDDPEKIQTARLRLAFDEAFIQQLAVARHRLQLQSVKAPHIDADVEKVKTFLATLPFQLTAGQKKAAWAAMNDMKTGHPMNRLLEGDVGSGKTLVAAIAALLVGSQGFQAVIIAPTEILAKQHYIALQKYFVDFGITVGLLTRSFHLAGNDEVGKKELLNRAKTNQIALLIGTHALIQDIIELPQLALVVIDEQHRFGVQQRGFLIKKNAERQPHLLSMTATPIPRTLALSLYGDLVISTLSELPQGRKKIITKVVGENKRAETYTFIKKQVGEGRQVFIITPRVEEGESEVKSVKAEFERLQKEIFAKLRLAMLHGKMKGADKDKIMADFNAGEIDILVATSVIEIGIDVPNATVVLIEGAEAFGLAQLHQLRGRVGRGEHQSYCFLFTTTEAGQDTGRLRALEASNDGFRLAELDLKLRGFGDLFGTQQSGFTFRYPAFMTFKALKMAKEGAEELLNRNSDLKKFPQLRAKSDELLANLHLE